MSLVRTLSPLVAMSAIALFVGGPGCKPKDEAPPPMPSATAEPTAVAPPPAVSTVQLQAAPPMPGVAPSTLSEAVLVTKPAMKDTTGGPDDGSTKLTEYWLAKSYPWSQLQGIAETQPTAFLSSTDASRGNRVCGTGTVQAFSQVQPKPAQYSGTLLTKTNETIAFTAVGDATGIKQGGTATFCGVASGVQTAGATKSITEVGMFDTPANRGATGGGGNFASLKACCQALQQNAASMPPPQNMYAIGAATYCNAMVASLSNPQQKDAMLAGIRGQLKGAQMPAACH